MMCSCSDSPDFIVVRDGPDASSPVIAQYCNTQRSEQVVSSGQHLYIDFIVDNQRHSTGFEATFEFMADPAAVLGAAVPQTLHVQTPNLMQQSAEGHGHDHQGTTKASGPSYHAGKFAHSSQEGGATRSTRPSILPGR